MKFSCAQDELARFLQITGRAIATKSTLPILTGILLETKGHYLRCVATDLEIAIEVTVNNVQIIRPGSVVVPGKTFVDIVKHLSQSQIEVEFDESSRMVQISTERSSYQLPTLPVEEFPALPEVVDNNKAEIERESLKDAIRQTIYATLADDPRPFLSTILWELTPEKLRLVATDVNRLAIKDLEISGNINGTSLVPVRSLREIGNIFGSNNEEKLQISIGDKLLFVSGSGITFSSRLVEAQFPRYEQVIPKEPSGTISINRSDLINALERTSVVSHSIKMKVTEEKLTITSKEPDKGRSYEEVAIELSGQDLEIGFNVRFLLDFLKAIDSERVVVKYVQEQKPVIMQGMDQENYIYIVMPLKLNA
jgi:DNA polymerase-3 subunit beta